MRIYHGQNICTRVIQVSYNLPYPALRLPGLAAIVCNLHYNLMPVYRAFRMLCRNKNIFRKLFIVRNDKAEIPAFLVSSYDFRNLVRQYFNDNAFPAFPGFPS